VTDGALPAADSEVTLAPSIGYDSGPKSIAEVLEMSVNQAVTFFADYPNNLRGLEPLQAVGLGYMGWASQCRRSPAARPSV